MKQLLVIGVLMLVLGAGVLAETHEPPTGLARPTLTVTKDTGTGDVVLSWTVTTAPYAPLRDDDPVFAGFGPSILAAGLSSTTYADPVLNDGQNYFYIIRDGESPPEVFGSDADGGLPGDSITLTGLGFASVPGDNQVFIAGTEATVTGSTDTTLTFAVPSQSVAGTVVVVTPKGANLGGEYYPIGTSGMENISSLAVDGAGVRFVADRGTSSTADRVFTFDPSNGSRVQVGFLGEPTGLPVDASNRVYYGNSTLNTFNGGTIERTSSGGGEALYRACGVASSNPCYVFGIGLDTDLTDFGPDGRVYVADGAQGRVRLVPPTGLIQDFVTGASFGNAPRGVAVALSPSSTIYHDVFVAEQNRVRQYDSSTIPGMLVTTYDASNSPVASPRQIAITKTPRERVLIADDAKDRLLMVNPATGASKALAIPLTDPRAVALEVDGSTTYAWVGEPTRVVRLPVYKTVYVSIWVAKGSGITEDDVRLHIARANTAASSCGYELQIRDDTINFFEAGSLLELEVYDKGSTSGCGDPAFQPTQEEFDLLRNTSRRSSVSTDLNVYFVKKFTQNGGNPGRTGEALTGDCFVGLNDATESGVIVSVEALARNSLGQDVSQLTIWTLAHEIGHALMDRIAWTPSQNEHYRRNGTALPANNLLAPEATAGRWAFNDPDQCENINADTTPFRGDP